MVSADLTIMEITMSRFLCYSAVSTLIFLAVNVMWSAARNNHSRSTQFVNGGVWQKQNILHIFILLNQSWRPCFIIISLWILISNFLSFWIDDVCFSPGAHGGLFKPQCWWLWWECGKRPKNNFCTACTVTVLCFGLWNRLNLLISFNGVSFVSLQHVMKFAEVTQDVVIARPESVR